MKKLLSFILFSSFIFYSCSENATEPPVQLEAQKGVYVLCEGLFGQNNSTITYYDSEKGQLVNDAYGKANGGTPLGDNANSMYLHENKAYIAVNGSNKIEVVDLQTFKSFGSVNLGQGSSPREIWIKDSVTGYVTSFSGKVIKFNPLAGTVLKNIAVGERPDGMAESNGKLFVANSWFGDINNISNTISVISLGSDAEIARIRVGINPTKILTGNDGKIYVMTTGSYIDESVFSGIYIIDPVNNLLIDSIKVGSNPFKICFSTENKMLVSNNNGVYEVNIADRTVSQNPLIPTARVTAYQYGQVYSLAYNSTTKQILCGNPKDFQQNGEVVFFDLNGNETNRITTGINPGTIVLK